MIKYEGNVSYEEGLQGSFYAGVFFSALKFKFLYNGETLDGGLYLFGHRLYTLDQLADNLLKSSENDGTDEEIKENPDINCDESTNTSYNQVTEERHIPSYKDINRFVKRNIDTLRKLRVALAQLLRNIKELLVYVMIHSDIAYKAEVIKSFKNILKQLLPRKMSGDFKFGLNDPYYTGKVLELFAVLYAKMGDELRVQPVWDEYCFLGSVDYNGRVHLTIILWNILRLMLNKHFRSIWREYNVK